MKIRRITRTRLSVGSRRTSRLHSYERYRYSRRLTVVVRITQLYRKIEKPRRGRQGWKRVDERKGSRDGFERPIRSKSSWFVGNETRSTSVGHVWPFRRSSKKCRRGRMLLADLTQQVYEYDTSSDKSLNIDPIDRSTTFRLLRYLRFEP